jgi:hypothetical protein
MEQLCERIRILCALFSQDPVPEVLIPLADYYIGSSFVQFIAQKVQSEFKYAMYTYIFNQKCTNTVTVSRIVFHSKTLKSMSSAGFVRQKRQKRCHLLLNKIWHLRFCYVVFNSHMFNASEVQLWKWCFHINFLLFKRPVHLWRSQTPDGVRCAHFPIVLSQQ